MSHNIANGWPDDETLVAFADGRLEDGEAEKVARYLDENAEARRFVERLVTSGGLAKVAYDAALTAPASDKLADLILGASMPEGDAARSNIVPLPRRLSRAPDAARYALPIAAAIALVIGGVAGYGLGRRGSAPDGGADFNIAVGPIAKGTPVAVLLEQRSSGDLLPVAGGAIAGARQLMVVASFRDRSGRICREFEVLTAVDAAPPVTAAIACRHDDGSWHVEGAAQVAAAPPIPDKDFSPASGNDASAMEGILEAIGAKPALSKTDEDALLRKGWK